MAEAAKQDWHDFRPVILIDQREKLPYTFQGYVTDKKQGEKPIRVTTRTCHLKTGDYTLEGFEDRVAIEKKSLEDWYHTLGQGRDRFEREFERLAKFQFAAVVIEATLTQIATEPPNFSQLNPKTSYRSLLAWMVRYPIRFIPCDCRPLAEVTTFRLLEKWLQEYGTEGDAIYAHTRHRT